jgi:hypothetical protein
MIIYIALLIPIITAIVLYVKYNHETTWWEILIPITASFIFIVIMKVTIETIQVSSEEYWGGVVIRVEYHEPWNEYIHRRCTRSCGKNCTTTYDCSYVQYHPPKWFVVNSINETIDISKHEYDRLVKHFGNKTFVELNRNYHTQDGDMYMTVWNRHTDKIIPTTTTHTYDNRVKAADHSVFHFGEVLPEDKQRYKLFDYPIITDGYKQQALLGDSSKMAIKADSMLRKFNGILGPEKEVKMFLLVHKNQPIDAGSYQEWLWCGGNMNEFIVSVGTDNDNKINWCKVISWTPNETLKASIRSDIQAMDSLDHVKIVNMMSKSVGQGFIRKDFHEFDYITVDPPTWAVALTFLLTLAINIGISYWVTTNEFNNFWKKFGNTKNKPFRFR